jgi:hypothetical protein
MDQGVKICDNVAADPAKLNPVAIRPASPLLPAKRIES